ncbi:uncharacterized protein LOC119777313 [Cyprinodon tularosa]|uniref:uncharacterized protein LOC119777313 n=1 Tax=Cyprinodon tularosa TaxID=77115 RepID=UPI0018E23C9B|nr:uncharacterized protein LOC119777313 [Cyprinodon tularosa]
MIHIWIVLIFLHQGYSVISVIKGELGEPVNLTCLFYDSDYSSTRVMWYKQSLGDSLKLITKQLKATLNPGLEQGFPSSRFALSLTQNKSTLTILKTIKEDEAVYHCAVMTWRTDEWTGTYLSLRDSNTRAIDNTIVQQPDISDPVHPGDSVTLQCSVFSRYQMGTCPGDQTVLWFGVKKDTFLESIIYTDTNTPYKCDRQPDISSHSKSCVYHFSKKVNFSDSGMYYCALALCGEIIFGNGTQIQSTVEDSQGSRWKDYERPLMFTLVAICVFAFVMTTFWTKGDFYTANDSLHGNSKKYNLQEEEDRRIYSTAVFTVLKNISGRDAEAAKREKIYVALKPFGEK